MNPRDDIESGMSRWEMQAGGGEREIERERLDLGRLRMLTCDCILGPFRMLERDLHFGSTSDARERLDFGYTSDAREGFAFGSTPNPNIKPQSITDELLAYWIVRSEWEQLPKVVVAKECLNSWPDEAFRSKSKDWTHPRCNTSLGLVCDQSTWFDRIFSAVPGGITEGLGFRV
jgi:hypothetical protein